jgi:predicted RNase H-like nuclease
MAPYLQRKLVESLPDLTFFQLNGERPLCHPNRTEGGLEERRALLVKMPGATRVINAEIPGVTPWDLVDAAALMWSARRISARAGKRIPPLPEWDESGLRMEILR